MSCPSSEHWYWCSDCTTLDIGCYLRWWNGQEWVDADDGQGACLAGINGKFSDGVYCYTVVNGVITDKYTCVYEIYFNICTDTAADGSGYVSVRIQAQNTTNYATGTLKSLNTSVTIGFTIYGESSGVISDSITIPVNSSNSGSPTSYGPGFGSGELVQSITITSVSPGSYTGQNYNAGSTNIGSC